jgi:malate dehydrogenase (quinone)
MDKYSKSDIVLIGAGIMSATLGVILKQLMPNASIYIFERLDKAAAESSDAWNNAGTGHSAFCELNYTPQNEDGTINIEKAIKIAESFEVSKQFWSFLIENNIIQKPDNFINSIPHISFVWGKENVNFLKKRHQALTKNSLFKDMLFSENSSQIEKWIPLVMENRIENEPIAATFMALGTDVNFGALTRSMFDYLKNQVGVTMHFSHQVESLKQSKKGNWKIKTTNLLTDKEVKVKTKFVFIGAGGGSLSLLEKSNIPEGKGFGGFPVSGQWLRCTNENIIKKHHAKVYGKAAVGSPPMSVPHIDTRIINGKQELLFGPYAGFSTKFLKEGSYFDLIKSIQLDNIIPMLSAGMKNIPLTKYLIDQVSQDQEERMESLLEYVPSAKSEDWVLETAGQRVQVIKKGEDGGGVLEFGTEVVSAADGSLAVLLGASPGASTATSIMLEVLKRCFAVQYSSSDWQEKLKTMIPSFGKSLNENEELCISIRKLTTSALKLKV